VENFEKEIVRKTREPGSRRQIVFDVSRDVHMEIKLEAAKRSISMNLLIMRAIYKYLKEFPHKGNT
jgi:predicted HicB family RNase H-like nuclease